MHLESVSDPLAKVRVPQVASLHQLRRMLQRIPYMPRTYAFLTSDKVRQGVRLRTAALCTFCTLTHEYASLLWG